MKSNYNLFLPITFDTYGILVGVEFSMLTVLHTFSNISYLFIFIQSVRRERHRERRREQDKDGEIEGKRKRKMNRGSDLEKLAAIVKPEIKPTKVNWTLSWSSAL